MQNPRKHASQYISYAMQKPPITGRLMRQVECLLYTGPECKRVRAQRAFCIQPLHIHNVPRRMKRS
jgi:hypothetical protein